MIPIILHSAKISQNSRQDLLAKLRVRHWAARWCVANKTKPVPYCFEHEYRFCVGYQFANEEEAALFKLTHL